MVGTDGNEHGVVDLDDSADEDNEDRMMRFGSSCSFFMQIHDLQ